MVETKLIQELKDDLDLYHWNYQNALIKKDNYLMGIYINKMKDCKIELEKLKAKNGTIRITTRTN